MRLRRAFPPSGERTVPSWAAVIRTCDRGRLEHVGGVVGEEARPWPDTSPRGASGGSASCKTQARAAAA